MILTDNINKILVECTNKYEKPLVKCIARDLENELYVIEGDLVTFDSKYLTFKLGEYPYENQIFKRQKEGQSYKNVPLNEIMYIDINYKVSKESIHISGDGIKDSREQDLYQTVESKLDAA